MLISLLKLSTRAESCETLNIQYWKTLTIDYHHTGAELQCCLCSWFHFLFLSFLYANMVLSLVCNWVSNVLEFIFSHFSVWKRLWLPTWTVKKWRCLFTWRRSFLKICSCPRLWRPGNTPSQPNRRGWWTDELNKFREIRVYQFNLLSLSLEIKGV